MRDLSGKIYYGLHFQQGVAEYKDMKDEDGKPLRIFINSETAKQMDATFAGKPVFVKHKDEVTEEDFKEADGYVTESFFNKADGNHWAKFIVTTEKGANAIKAGWKLSNAYFRRQELGAGRWHGVDYDSEVRQGEYEHLAIVDDPRYEESIVLTPDQFKTYNADKETELLKLANSKRNEKRGATGMLNLFKREKIENSADLENTMVTLPRSGIDLTITDLVKNADEAEMKKDETPVANGDETVEIGDEKMTVNELKEKYEQMMKSKNEAEEEAAANGDDPEDKKDSMENEDEDEIENEDEDEIENEDEDEIENEDDEEDPKAKNENFDALKNAEKNAEKVVNSIDLGDDKLARGRSRYGS